MSPNDILTLTRRRPFLPFRIVTSDGTLYEIRHPEMVFVTIPSLIVGYPSKEDETIPYKYDTVSMRHVIRLEPVGGAR